MGRFAPPGIPKTYFTCSCLSVSTTARAPEISAIKINSQFFFEPHKALLLEPWRVLSQDDKKRRYYRHRNKLDLCGASVHSTSLCSNSRYKYGKKYLHEPVNFFFEVWGSQP